MKCGRRPWALLFSLLIIIAMQGCSSATSGTAPAASGDSGYPLTIVDDAGREVVIESPPQRLISLSPSNTEVLFALGLDDKIVGVTNYCNYPEKASQYDKVGGFSNPNIERIVDLQPDLVVAGDRHLKEAQVLDEMGIDVIIIDARRTGDISKSIRIIGQACAVPAEADQLGQSIDDRVAAISAMVATSTERPRVFYQVFTEPLTTAGPNTIINDLITVCGGSNIAADTNADYPQFSEEAVIDRNPEVIIQCGQHGSQQADASQYGSQWQSVSAVQNGRVYAIDGDISTRSGPRILQALDVFLACIHPELAPSPDTTPVPAPNTVDKPDVKG